MPPEDSSPSPPPVADYELLRQVGRGSYGDVWLARGITGLYRAVKIVWRDRFKDNAPYEREFKGLSDFMRLTQGEVRQLALLHVGRDDTRGFFYYVMELADDVVTGNQIDPLRYEPLTLNGLRDAQAHLPADQVLHYGIELAAGLDELHGAGLVHRDIKPSNIILVDGRPKLADIGLVSAEQDAMTFVGTEGFVPPEGPGNHGADIFSLGKVLYEIATGNDRNDFPRLPTNLNKRKDRAEYLELNEVIIKAAAPNVAERYPDAAALRDELQLLAAGKSVRRLRFAEAGAARARKWILLAVIVALVAGAGAFAERRRANLESAARRTAETELANLTRRTLHDASLAAAQRALETGNYGAAREALERAIPPHGDPDPRGFEWHALYREAQGDPAEMIRSAGDKVTRIEASPDGQWVAIDQLPPTIELYDQHSGKLVRTLEGIHRIAGFSADGKRLVGTTPEYAIETWSVENGTPDATIAKSGINRPLQVHPELPHILYFEDGVDNQDHRLGIWNFETGMNVVSWPIPSREPEGLSVFMAASATPDFSKVLLVTTADLNSYRTSTLRIISLKSGEVEVQEKAGILSPAAISPDGTLYVARRNTLTLNAVSDHTVPLKNLPYDILSKSIKFHPEGSNFMFGATDNRLVLIDSETGNSIREFVGAGNQIDAISYARQNTQIWTALRNGEIRRWDRDIAAAPAVTTRINISAHDRVRDLKIDNLSEQLAVNVGGSQLVVLNLRDLREKWRKTGVVSTTYFGNEEIIVLTEEKQLVRVAAADGRNLGLLFPDELDSKIKSATVSPNGNLLLVFTENEEIVFADLSLLRILAQYSAEKIGRSLGEILTAQLTDTGTVISTDVRRELLLWDASSGEIQRTVSVPEQPSKINLSPRNDLIVLAGNDDNPTVRAIPSLEPILTIDSGRRNGVDFAFHPQELKLMTQFMRGSLNSIDIATGQLGPSLEIGVDTKASDLAALVSEIVYSPDGQKLVTVDHLGNIRIWRR